MSYLKERIIQDGIVINENILKVDSFLNHQIDPKVMREVSKQFVEYFGNKGVTKILTIEASGIAPAIWVASDLGVPMLFAKKTEPSTLKSEDLYATEVHSFTKNKTSRVIVSKKYLKSEDKVLIIDDFLANGEASLGLMDLVKQSGAEVVGVGICIEKSFQSGREKLEQAGADIYSICRIKSLANQTVEFVEDEE
ncbi:xanthine phosphoribosyltransferase [Allofustis seminis]|uniref:xanthine phosphoribosyltransferase n=1 Tax=Allofustis seminis TaxID=166939 RepID=UPI0003815FDD|nr:xanthine phosphoribosyltransferase [Allofustis seminis]